MTGLPNRRAFEAVFESEYRAAGAAGEQLCVVFCDIDHFKRINDEHGHGAGDRVLKLVAEPLAQVSDDPLLGFAPYLHAAPRRNSITPERQREFIAALAATGIVTQAARQIGASLEALYRLRHQPGAEGSRWARSPLHS